MKVQIFLLLNAALLFSPTHQEKVDLQSITSLDEVCQHLSEKYTRNEEGVFTCNCSGDVQNFVAYCVNQMPTCWYQAPSVSDIQYTVDFTFQETWHAGRRTSNYEECLYHAGSCNTVCVGTTMDIGAFAAINGLRCQSATPCQSEESDEEDYIYDCSNIIPDAVVNMCTGEGLDGSPFEPWSLVSSSIHAPSAFEPGACGNNEFLPRGLLDACTVTSSEKDDENIFTTKEEQQDTLLTSRAIGVHDNDRIALVSIMISLTLLLL